MQDAQGRAAKHIEALRLRVKEYKQRLADVRRDLRQANRTIRTFEVRPDMSVCACARPQTARPQSARPRMLTSGNSASAIELESWPQRCITQHPDIPTIRGVDATSECRCWRGRARTSGHRCWPMTSSSVPKRPILL